MAYRSTDKTRQKKDAKRTAMMQAAVQVFAEKGYHAATVRDIVQVADVAIGTFYFYFPDKEMLFNYLYEETADFLLQAIGQAVRGRSTLPQQVRAGIQAYLNLAIYEPAAIHLLLLGGVGAIPSLASKQAEFRERMITTWQRPLEAALTQGLIVPQNTRRSAEALAGAFDEVVLSLMNSSDPVEEAQEAFEDLALFALRAVVWTGA